MSKQIVIKPEFEAKLKNLRVKTRFIRNCKDHMRNNPSTENMYKSTLEQTSSWFGFIVQAFSWVTTPEGHYFWDKIANS